MRTSSVKITGETINRQLSEETLGMDAVEAGRVIKPRRGEMGVHAAESYTQIK